MQNSNLPMSPVQFYKNLNNQVFLRKWARQATGWLQTSLSICGELEGQEEVICFFKVCGKIPTQET